MLLPKEVVQVWSASYTPHPIALRWTYDKLCIFKRLLPFTNSVRSIAGTIFEIWGVPGGWGVDSGMSDGGLAIHRLLCVSCC